jgi:hypothetical protein
MENLKKTTLIWMVLGLLAWRESRVIMKMTSLWVTNVDFTSSMCTTLSRFTRIFTIFSRWYPSSLCLVLRTLHAVQAYKGYYRHEEAFRESKRLLQFCQLIFPNAKGQRQLHRRGPLKLEPAQDEWKKKIWTISRFVRVILAQGPC